MGKLRWEVQAAGTACVNSLRWERACGVHRTAKVWGQLEQGEERVLDFVLHGMGNYWKVWAADYIWPDFISEIILATIGEQSDRAKLRTGEGDYTPFAPSQSPIIAYFALSLDRYPPVPLQNVGTIPHPRSGNLSSHRAQRGPYDNPEVLGKLSLGWTLSSEKHNMGVGQANKVVLLCPSCMLPPSVLQGVVLPKAV